MAQRIDATYPTIAQWVMEYGWIEIGQDHMSQSFVRALMKVAWSGKGRQPMPRRIMCPDFRVSW